MKKENKYLRSLDRIHCNNILMYVLIVAAIAVMAFSLYVTVSNTYGAQYQKAIAAQNPADICATPAGYTDAEWQEHMSHHPDMYAECLG